MRLVTVTCRMRHLALWWGRMGFVVIWPLAQPRAAVPLCSLTWPRQSGGTLCLRLGPLTLVWQGRP